MWPGNSEILANLKNMFLALIKRAFFERNTVSARWHKKIN
jgi:hypothetical protein